MIATKNTIDNKVRLSAASISDLEKEAVLIALNNGYFGMGEAVKCFEQELKDYLQTTGDVVCVNTGTSALHLALAALGIGSGDEVLVPSLTYVASYQAISATGAKPVPCDVIAETGFIDLEDAAARITPKTQAIMPVDYASSTKGMKAVHTFAKQHNLRVVEDAAHAFGSLDEEDKLVGQQGDILCFSFDGIKNITSGEGGAIVSFDPQVTQHLQDLRLLGVERDTEKRYAGQRSWDFDVTEQGFRYHMSNIMAALGRAQLQRIDDFIAKRRQIAQRYYQALRICDGVMLFDLDYDVITPHIFVIKAQNRDDLRAYLAEQGIETGFHYKPNHLLTKYKTDYALPVTEQLATEILTLPCHFDLTEDEQNKVIQTIRKFYTLNG